MSGECGVVCRNELAMSGTSLMHLKRARAARRASRGGLDWSHGLWRDASGNRRTCRAAGAGASPICVEGVQAAGVSWMARAPARAIHDTRTPCRPSPQIWRRSSGYLGAWQEEGSDLAQDTRPATAAVPAAEIASACRRRQHAGAVRHEAPGAAAIAAATGRSLSARPPGTPPSPPDRSSTSPPAHAPRCGRSPSRSRSRRPRAPRRRTVRRAAS